MKKKAIVCDDCGGVISTNLNLKKRQYCVICERDLCSSCGELFMEELFDDKYATCEKCGEAITDFNKTDYKILNEKFSKELIETIKKLIMTNEIEGNTKQ
jgi:DNA-directed RNA polymerase subunit RPC12/RpoP